MLERKWINYGHALPTNGDPYKGRVVNDLKKLWQAGYRGIRVVMPPYDGQTIELAKYIMVTALQMGFQGMYGVVSSGTTVTAARHAAHLDYVKNTVAPWLDGLVKDGVPIPGGRGVFRPAAENVILCVDNEISLHLGADLPIATAFTNLHNLAGELKAAYPMMTIGTVEPMEYLPQMQTAGTANYDFVGLNAYYAFLPTGKDGWNVQVTAAKLALKGKLFVAEWSAGTGWFNAVKDSPGDPEEAFARAMYARLKYLEATGVPHCIFALNDGQFGVVPDSYALVPKNGRPHRAWFRMTGQKEPSYS